jgi:hypothetical protein
MRRKVRTYPFARLRVTNLKEAVIHAPLDKLPRHLQLSCAILEADFKLPTAQARCILRDSIAQAVACARSITSRDLALSRSTSRGKVSTSFSRLAKCIARAPAALRRELDDQVYEIIAGIIDSEVIEAIIDKTYQTFARSNSEPAQTALKALVVSAPIAKRNSKKTDKKKKAKTKKARIKKTKKILGLKVEYEALDPATHRKCELAVGAVLRGSVSGTAATVFKALAAALDSTPASKISRESSDLIVDYVANVGALWRNNNLSPSRAIHRANPKYRSKFHRFVELVLTAVTEPDSSRHTANVDEMTAISQRIRVTHTLLPPEERSKIGQGLRRVDREWLVSDDHIRKALRSTTLKTGQDTP